MTSIEASIQKSKVSFGLVQKIYWLTVTSSLIAPSSAQNLALTEVTDELLQTPPKGSWLSWRGGAKSWGIVVSIKLIAVTLITFDLYGPGQWTIRVGQAAP